MRPTASTQLFVVLGDPVAHSLSPLFQNAGFRAAGLDAVFLAQRCSADALPTVMATVAGNGGGGSITVPHKAIAATVGTPSDVVKQLSVANAFVGRGDEILVDNTDVLGIVHSLEHLEAPTTAWLLVGAGGSARAVVGAAARCGAKLAVRSRAPERAKALQQFASSIGVPLALESECEVAINATPIGMLGGEALPLDPRGFPFLKATLDLVYRSKGTTLWVETCRAAGIAAIDGRELLLSQGAAAWALWFPGVTPPVEVMRAALLGQLD